MVCRNCGRELPQGALFCPRCGARTDAPVYSVADVPDPYYAREFASIAAGNPGRFNFAAFFLGPFHALYRGFFSCFWKLYFPLLLVQCVGELFACLYAGNIALSQLNTGGTGTLFGPPVLVSWLFSVVCGVWGLTVAIYNGATFNRRYCAYVQGDATRKPHVGALIGLIAGYLVWIVALVALIFSMAFRAFQTSSDWDLPEWDDYNSYYEDEWAGDEFYNGSYGSQVDDIFQQYLDYDQAYINGYLLEAERTGSYLEQFQRAHMFYSDEIPVYQAMSAGFDQLSVTEDVVENEELGVDAYLDITAVLGDTTFQLTVQQWDSYVWFVGQSCYLTDSPDDVYYMSVEELESVLAYCYEQLDGSDTSSMARAVRGSWSEENGSTFKITADTLAGEYYGLGTMIDGKVQGWNTDGGYVLMSVDESGENLTLEYYDAEENLTQTKQCTRA